MIVVWGCLEVWGAESPSGGQMSHCVAAAVTGLKPAAAAAKKLDVAVAAAASTAVTGLDWSNGCNEFGDIGA